METEKEAIPLESTLEDVGPCRKKMSITVPGTHVTDEINKQYEDIIQSYQFKGFRKGKVPRRLVEKQLGDHVMVEVKQTLVIDSFEQVLEQQELSPIGEPDIDMEGLEVKDGEELAFDVTFEIRPTFELPDVSKIEVEREVQEVTDEDIDGALERLARNRGEYKECADPGEIRADDMVQGDTALIQNDETILHHEEFRFIPGEKRVYGLVVEDLPEKIAGAEFGKTVEIEIDIPAYLAGAGGRLVEGKALIRITPESVQRLETPPIDDELAKGLDFDSLDELKADIRKQGEGEAERAADRDVEEKILDAMVEATPFDIPENFVEQQLDHTLEQERVRMQMSGMDNLEIEEKIDLARNKHRDELVSSMRKAFILESAAKAEKIFVTEEMILETMRVLAAQRGKSLEELQAEFAESGQVRHLRTELRERMTRESLRKKAKVSDKKPKGKD